MLIRGPVTLIMLFCQMNVRGLYGRKDGTVVTERCDIHLRISAFRYLCPKVQFPRLASSGPPVFRNYNSTRERDGGAHWNLRMQGMTELS
ncbi:hypothetical protein QBC43DRAFT_322256 [Cladorrhinum sp. PSN259]|nr:hypothetical protein QBC43DRAFT_322256 [Cladorrhinum sp. PSN259]